MKTAIYFYLFLVGAALCQSPTYRSPAYPRLRSTDGRDLYQRIMASDYVVTGTVAKFESPGERLSPEQKAEHFKAGLGSFKYGLLYTIAVEGPVCRKTDFLPVANAAAGLGSEVHIFVSQEEGPLPYDGHYVEALVPGARYLLFLMRDPKQADMIKEYELNPDVTYYRAVDEARGAIPLPKETEKGKNGDVVTPFAAAVTSLCQAVRTDSMIDKLKGLGSLRFSVDPATRDTAEAALKKLTEAEDLGRKKQ